MAGFDNGTRKKYKLEVPQIAHTEALLHAFGGVTWGGCSVLWTWQWQWGWQDPLTPQEERLSRPWGHFR